MTMENRIARLEKFAPFECNELGHYVVQFSDRPAGPIPDPVPCRRCGRLHPPYIVEFEVVPCATDYPSHPVGVQS